MFKRVLVYTYGDQSHKHTLEQAAKFAAENKAHLTGIYIKPDYANYGRTYGPYLFGLIESLYEKLEEYSQKNRQEFEHALSAYEVEGEWHSMDQYAEGPNPALYSDCIFTSQVISEETAAFNGSDFIDQLLMNTGAPIVLIPKDWQTKDFATRPVLAWKESKEAASTVRQTLALLQKPEQADVVNVAKNKTADEQLVDGIQISEYLTAHNVNCTFKSVEMGEKDKSESDALINYVKRNSNDLIVMGGYSRSRMREIIFGGMTRDLIDKCPVPLIMVH